MRKISAILLALLLIIIPSLQATPAEADETEIILTLDDLVGKWNGTQTIDFAEGDIDPEWLENNRNLEKYIQINYWDGEYTFGQGWYTANNLALHADGGLYGFREYKSNVDGSHTATFVIEGTVTYEGGQLKMTCYFGYTQYKSIHGNEQKLYMTFNGVKEGTLAATAAPPATTEEPIDFGPGKEKGRITFIQGRAYIHRMGRIIPATMSESLMAGDLIVMDEGEVTIEGNEGGSLKLVGRTRFALPEETAVKKTSSSALSEMLGNIWSKTKELLAGESFEVKTPTGTCGVRG